MVEVEEVAYRAELAVPRQKQRRQFWEPRGHLGASRVRRSRRTGVQQEPEVMVPEIQTAAAAAVVVAVEAASELQLRLWLCC